MAQYGDEDNRDRDVKILMEILGRQGSNLLIDVIAEAAGTCANKFKLDDSERQNIADGLVSDLKNTLAERMKNE